MTTCRTRDRRGNIKLAPDVEALRQWKGSEHLRAAIDRVSRFLEHKDSLGNGTVIGPGEVQRMSAGIGILHSEFNPSEAEPVYFLQMWIIPGRAGFSPSYELDYLLCAPLSHQSFMLLTEKVLPRAP